MNSILILCDKAPFGTNTVIEAFRLGSGFLGLGDIKCKIVLFGDAVLFLHKNLNSVPIEVDSPAEGIEMAELTEIPIAVVKEDMKLRGMSDGDLREYAQLSVISQSEIAKLIQEYGGAFHI
jgi:sulfur relay (sulfurtransferase) complex TusBCD TusD component (DsrE family)